MMAMYAMMRLVGWQLRWAALSVFDKCLLLPRLSTGKATTKTALAFGASLITEAMEATAVGFAHVVSHDVFVP